MDKMANLIDFKHDCEEIKEDVVETGEERINDLALTLQTPPNYASVNKRTLF